MIFRLVRRRTASPVPVATAETEDLGGGPVGAPPDDRGEPRGRRGPVHEMTVRSPFALGFTITLGGLLAIVVGGAIGQLSTIILYVVAALFVALGLDPIVRWLERRSMSRPTAIGVVFGGFALIVVGLLALIVPLLATQVGEFLRLAPRYLTDIQNQEWFLDLNSRVGSAVDLDRLLDLGMTFIGTPKNWTNLAGGIWQAGIGVANGVTATIVVLILSLYFLASLSRMKEGAYALAPRSARYRVIDITEQVTTSIGGYVNGMVVLALLNAGLGFIAMTVCGVPFAGVVAVVVFLLALIPLIGSVLATVLVVVIGLFNSPATALAIGIYYVIYMQLEAYLLTPRIMNRVVSVPGSLVVIGALAGGTLLGLLGALIAIPVTAALLMIVKQVVIPAQNER
ncbi:AI-2E family transporter [Klugiella xanthotipulae]|uniref:Putative PurR-regulated permease PerM n=1 Tax=Klugiella xanthotipulae TaxID=244735 RepID=A0A543I3Y1_9MICO|nr:AI-2E family transporter [Klugiella xanthotipulae]TQM65285.1 putative PurR-regulated permease PerM [Klugiella xanthotipulae]